VKKAIFYLMLLALIVEPLQAQTTSRTTKSQASAAAEGSFDATALSMVVWGTGMAIVIATAAILIPNSTDDNSGNNSHAN